MNSPHPFDLDPQPDSDADAALRLAGDFEMDDAEQARVHRRAQGDGPSDSDVARMWMNSYNEYVADNARLYKLIDKFQELTQEQYNKYQEELAALRAELAAARGLHDAEVDMLSRALASAKAELTISEGALALACGAANSTESALSAVTESRDRMRTALDATEAVFRAWCDEGVEQDEYGPGRENKAIHDCLMELRRIRAALATDAPASGAGDEVAG